MKQKFNYLIYPREVHYESKLPTGKYIEVERHSILKPYTRVIKKRAMRLLYVMKNR